MGTRRAIPAAAAAALALLSMSCGTHSSRSSHSCADLRFEGRPYDEWRRVDRVGVMQELGDANYPACSAAGKRHRSDLDGFGATDVWRLEGVDPAKAVIGLREGTHVYVIFVRTDVDPHTLPQGAGGGT